MKTLWLILTVKASTSQGLQGHLDKAPGNYLTKKNEDTGLKGSLLSNCRKINALSWDNWIAHRTPFFFFFFFGRWVTSGVLNRKYPNRSRKCNMMEILSHSGTIYTKYVRTGFQHWCLSKLCHIQKSLTDHSLFSAKGNNERPSAVLWLIWMHE